MSINEVNHSENIQNAQVFTYQNFDTKSDSFEETAEEYIVHGVVLMRGDMFYGGDFVPWSSIKDASQHALPQQIHDINHKGTGYVLPSGQFVESDINYIVGYQNNFSVDDVSKSLKMDVHILKKSPMTNAWKAYYDICQISGRMPNVSSQGYKRVTLMKAQNLPVDFNALGLRKDDLIACVTYLDIQAGSTVYKGACNDKDGCGMPVRHTEVPSEGEHESRHLSFLRQRIKILGGNKI